jgi:hypothetical protein
MAVVGEGKKEATAGMLGLCRSSAAMAGVMGAREEERNKRGGGYRGTT